MFSYLSYLLYLWKADIAITRPSSGTFLRAKKAPFFIPIPSRPYSPVRPPGGIGSTSPRRDPYSALLGWLSHTRCPPSWPFSPGPGGHLPTRGASLLAPTRRCGLLAASGAHPPGAIPTRPYLGGSLTRDARLLGPSRPAREATSLREVPASLPLLARAREAAPHARCQPSRPYSRGLAGQATLLLAPSSSHPWRCSGRT
jgi:hypothetical protein